MRYRYSLRPLVAAIAAVCAVLAVAATCTAAEPSRLRIAGPAWMLSDDNPLKQGLPYDGAVTVELPGRRYDPPLAISAVPRDSQAPKGAELERILAHLRGALQLEGAARLHAVAYHKDVLVALVTVEGSRPEPARVFALVEDPGTGWRHSAAALKDPVIEVVHQGWRESGYFEVIAGDAGPVD